MTRKHFHKSKRSRRGFTLVEMIVATLLLAIGVAGSLAAFSAATRATTAADRNQTAMLLARQKLTEIELRPDTLTGGDQDGDFGSDYPDYHWQQSVETTDFQNLFQVTVTITWGMRTGVPHQVSLATYLRNDQAQVMQATTPGANNTTGGTGASNGP